MVRIRCHCGKSLKLPPEHVGKPASCPRCRKRVRIVAAERFTDSNKLKGVLVLKDGPSGQGEQIFLGGSTPIDVGKAESAHLRLLASSVSRRHCRLVPSDRGWRIEDTGSTNGLFVNGRQVKGHNLIHGDVVRIGDFELRYVYESTKHETIAAQEQFLSSAETAVSEANASLGLHFLDDTVALGATATAAAASAGSPAAKKAKKAPPPDEGDLFEFAEDHNIESGPPISLPVSRAVEEVTACPNCKRPVQPGSAICVACGTDLSSGRMLGTDRGELAKERAKGSGSIGAYVRDCARGFAFIMNPGSLVTFIIVAFIACLQPFVSMVSGIASFVIQGLICSYMFSVVLRAANGEEDLPELSINSGWWDDIIAPFLKFFATWAIALGPAIAYAGFVLAGGASMLLNPGPDIIALFALGIFLWPIIVLAIALGGISSIARIDLIFKTVIASFVPYLVTFVLTALAFAVTYFTEIALPRLVATTGGNLIVAEVVSLIVGVYCWIVAMRCIGLYYHHFKGRFAWSWG